MSQSLAIVGCAKKCVSCGIALGFGARAVLPLYLAESEENKYRELKTIKRSSKQTLSCEATLMNHDMVMESENGSHTRPISHSAGSPVLGEVQGRLRRLGTAGADGCLEYGHATAPASWSRHSRGRGRGPRRTSRRCWRCPACRRWPGPPSSAGAPPPRRRRWGQGRRGPRWPSVHRCDICPSSPGKTQVGGFLPLILLAAACNRFIPHKKKHNPSEKTDKRGYGISLFRD